MVANAITAKGVSTSTSATFSTMATNISKIFSTLSLKQTDKYNTGKNSGTNTRQITLTNDISKGYIVNVISAVIDGSGATASSFSIKSNNSSAKITKVNQTTNSFAHGSTYANAMIIQISLVENLKKGDVLTVSASTGESAAFVTLILA